MALPAPSDDDLTPEFRYERAALDVLALADVIDVLLAKRWIRQADREFAQRRLDRIRGRYPDPLG